jgi:hypothetical protein
MTSKRKAAGRRGARSGNAAVKAMTRRRPWGMIVAFGAVGLVVVLIIGYAGWALWRPDRPAPQHIDGLTDYRVSHPDGLSRNHATGTLSYKMTLPVGGDHNPVWQNCTGDVYVAPIANEHAVHSLEHGAVWITYRPDLPRDRVDALANRVRGSNYTLMSPYPGLDAAVSLQAWGYQLKVGSVTDPRIDLFIGSFRQSAAAEPGATCAGGVTATGTVPHDLTGG